MTKTNWRRLGAWLILGLLLLYAFPALAQSTPVITISKCQVKGADVDSGKIYLREDTPFKLEFALAANSSGGGDTDTYDAETSTTTYENHDFKSQLYLQATGGTNTTIGNSNDLSDGDKVSYNLTTNGINPPDFGHKLAYSYTLIYEIKYTQTKTQNTYNISTGLYDTTTSDSALSTTKSVTINVRLDPPAKAVLSADVVSGDSSLYVSWNWDDFAKSELTGASEPNLRVVFCLNEVGVVVDGDADTTEALASSRLLAAGESAPENETAIVPDGDGEAEKEVVPDGDGEAEKEAVLDGDAESETAVDGDNDSDSELDPDADAADGDSEQIDTDLGDNITDPDAGGCQIFDGGGATKSPHTIEGLQNGVIYEIRAKALDLAGNYSREWSEPVTGTPRQVDDFWRAYKKAGGKEDGGYCFIATATYGSYSAHEVQLLRLFRDRILLRLPFGRSLVEWYYEASPPLADFIREHESLKGPVSVLLYPLVLLMAFVFEVGAFWQGLILGTLMLGLGALAFALIRRERKEVRS